MFKKLLITAALAVSSAAPLSAAARSDVGVSVSVGQPGFYGRIDIGDAPQPQLVYPQPVIIQQPPRNFQRSPIYMHVPPAQAQQWRRYCGRYNACGQPVYFVQDRWYNDVYAPRRHHAAPPPHYRGKGPVNAPHRRGNDDSRRGRHDDGRR